MVLANGRRIDSEWPFDGVNERNGDEETIVLI